MMMIGMNATGELNRGSPAAAADSSEAVAKTLDLAGCSTSWC
jgi:hypothetical protein